MLKKNQLSAKWLAGCIVLMALLLLLIPACTQKKITALKIGTLPRTFDLALYVAQEEGIFQKYGLTVELVTFRSAHERSTALLAGEIDGTLEDLFEIILLNSNGIKAKVVAQSPMKDPMILIIASAKSNINSPSGLKNSTIATSSNTIMEYALDKLLMAQNINQEEIVTVFIPQMPLRLEALNQGKVKAAILTPPLSDMAVYSGGMTIMDDGGRLGIPNLVFSLKTLENSPEDMVTRFTKAWQEATRVINNNPEKYRSRLIEVAKVPQECQQSIKMPYYLDLRQPEQNEVESKVNWLLEHKILKERINYETIVGYKK